MAVITDADIEALAHLCRVELDAEGVARGRSYLGAIVGLLETLEAVDTSGIPPFVAAELVAALHDPPGPTALREDTPGPRVPAAAVPS
jgi:aspartyl/glutamyl-tRNA(Asn/Gln) amidotransferase C subunit